MVTTISTITTITEVPLYEIASIIRKDWVDKQNRPNIHFSAEPYVEAMETLTNITDKYICDDGRDVVLILGGEKLQKPLSWN
jgi:hypothetical protein